MVSHVWVGDAHVLQLRDDVDDGGLWMEVAALERAEGVARDGGEERRVDVLDGDGEEVDVQLRVDVLEYEAVPLRNGERRGCLLDEDGSCVARGDIRLHQQRADDGVDVVGVRARELLSAILAVSETSARGTRHS